MMDVGVIYLAGFFDGEGSIYIVTHRRGDRRYHELKVTLVNTFRPALEKCQDAFGGLGKVVPRGGTFIPAFEWRLKARQAETVVRAMLPHLVVKKEQAELALQFMASKKKRFGRGKPLTTEELAERDRLRDAIRELNDGGFSKRRLKEERQWWLHEDH